MYAPLEHEVAKTYYRGQTIFMFADGTFGLALETMSAALQDVWHGNFDTFETMMTRADQLADQEKITLPKNWERVHKELQKEAASRSRKK